MERSERSGRSIGIGFLAALVIYSLISINSYSSIDRFVIDSEKLTHTHQVMEKLEGVLSLLKDAETGQRGFILTGKKIYLEPYNRSVSEVNESISELRRLTADSEEHQRHIDELEKLVARKFEELNRTIGLRSSEGFSSSVKVIETNMGKQIMDSIRKTISDMKETEQASIEQQLKATSTNAGVALGTLILGNAMAFVILAVSITLLFRQVAERRKAEDALRTMNENLAELVGERTAELRQTNEALQAETISRKQIEDELIRVHKFESLGVLAGGLAHDFNNLLTVISGNLNLGLMNLDKDNTAAHRFRESEKAARRAADLTRQLITFSKAGVPVKKKCMIGSIIRDTAALALSGTSTNFDLSVADNLPEINADAGQISQVIHNLVINADHAMAGGGTVNMRCELVPVAANTGLPLRSGDYIKISVSDRGVGIPQEHIQKIFDPYFSTKQKGSGLGLAMSYSIISKHDGHISVESEVGKGTTFNIYLPV